MGDPIVISDDSDVEWISDCGPWRPPKALDANPGPSYGRGAASSPLPVSPPAVFDSSQITVSLSSPGSPDSGSAKVMSSGTCRPLDLIDLTDDSDLMNAVLARCSPTVIDLTDGDDDSSVTEIACARSNIQRSVNIINTGGSDLSSLLQPVCSDRKFRVGREMVPARERTATIPKRRSSDSAVSERQPKQCRISLGSSSSISSDRNSHKSVKQVRSTIFSRDGSSLGSFRQTSDATAISSASSSYSHGAAVPHVQESFHQAFFDSSEEKGSDEQNSEPIPEANVQIVVNTIEANFPEATVQRLAEFVTPHFYPPRHLLSYLIRNILLGPDIGTLLNETFKLLTRIQELHPANLTQVEWDWELVTSVMQEKEIHLPGHVFFLRYVIKTLEDDFQKALKQPPDQMQATIASSVLSCDKHPHNIKNVIKWLVDILSGPDFPPLDIFPLTVCRTRKFPVLSPQAFARKNSSQLTVLYLQKMLAIAVEADHTPTCSSSKIAEMLFGFVLNIPERNQREAFFTSMENHLLRCKVLEILLLHSCNERPTLPLSFAQILYFLNNATSLYNRPDNIQWESWDELVEHLQFLLISYHRVLTDHLRTSIKERKNASKNVRAQTQPSDDITALDIEQHIEGFRVRMVHMAGGAIPLHLQEKLFLLKLFFLQAIHGRPLLESQFQDGHLMRAYSLLDQEFPSHV